MKRSVALLAAGVAGAMITLLALSLAGRTFAQGPNGQQPAATANTAPSGQMMGRGQMAGHGQTSGPMMGSGQSLVGMAAAELNLTQAELVAQLGSDGTIAATLKAQRIDPAGFVDRFVATRARQLDAAVAAGTLTREEADARLALARSMAAARIAQPFTALGPGGQGPGMGVGQGAGQGTCQGDGFVDADGDGVCDNQPAAGQGPGFVDANSDGVCDHQPAGGGGGRGPMGGRGGRP